MIKLVHREDDRGSFEAMVSTNYAVCAIVESPESTLVDVVSPMLKSAIGLQEFDFQVPAASHIAEVMERELLVRGRETGLDQWAFFVSAIATLSYVEICMSGPFRVHLIKDGRLVASAREHILQQDPFEDGELASIDLNTHGNVVTRSLGDPHSRPAETTRWPISPPYRVVICTTDFHQYRAPEAYLTLLGDVGDARVPEWSEGTVAILDFSGVAP